MLPGDYESRRGIDCHVRPSNLYSEVAPPPQATSGVAPVLTRELGERRASKSLNPHLLPPWHESTKLGHHLTSVLLLRSGEAR